MEDSKSNNLCTLKLRWQINGFEILLNQNKHHINYPFAGTNDAHAMADDDLVQYIFHLERDFIDSNQNQFQNDCLN